MRRRMTWMLVLGLSISGATASVGIVRASMADGFTGTTVAVGRFGAIDAFNLAIVERQTKRGPRKDVWLSSQKTRGESDLYIQSNVWVPGGTTGWHSHPGHSLIIVTAGTVTAYEADDPACTPHAYTVGMGFVDEGGDHVHVIRNEGSVEARTMTVQLIPAGATRRVDADGPSTCPF
jgi:hypothetical protein